VKLASPVGRAGLGSLIAPTSATSLVNRSASHPAPQRSGHRPPPERNQVIEHLAEVVKLEREPRRVAEVDVGELIAGTRAKHLLGCVLHLQQDLLDTAREATLALAYLVSHGGLELGGEL
jgi:hypothetical protein